MKINLDIHIGRRTFNVSMKGPRIAIQAHKRPKRTRYQYKHGDVVELKMIDGMPYRIESSLEHGQSILKKYL